MSAGRLSKAEILYAKKIEQCVMELKFGVIVESDPVQVLNCINYTTLKPKLLPCGLSHEVSKTLSQRLCSQGAVRHSSVRNSRQNNRMIPYLTAHHPPQVPGTISDVTGPPASIRA